MLVIVFSDGRDTASWTRPEQALALAGRSGAVVDAVVMGDLLPTGSARLVDHDRLTPDERFAADLAVSTGGRVRNGNAGAGLGGAFRDALQQFRARYEIVYTPTGSAPGWHAIDSSRPATTPICVHITFNSARFPKNVQWFRRSTWLGNERLKEVITLSQQHRE